MGYFANGRLEDFGREEPLLAAAERTTRRAGDWLHQRTTELTPVAKPPPGHELEWLEARKRLPGTLRDSWRIGELDVIDGGRSYRIDVFTRDQIAPYVEWPTLPHIIVPRRPGGMLRFWDKLGNTIYARIVHHTGTKGSYMLTTALSELAVTWQQFGEEEMDRWAHEQQALVAA